MANILEQINEFSGKAQGILTSVGALTEKVKSFDLPSVKIAANVPAQYEMTSQGAPGKMNAYTIAKENNKVFMVLGLIAVGVAVFYFARGMRA